MLNEEAKKVLNIDSIEFSNCQLNETASFCEATSNIQGKATLISVFNSGGERKSTLRVKVRGRNLTGRKL